MRILLRVIAVLLFLIGASLVYFVIAAFADSDTAEVRLWVAAIYVVLALVAMIASIATWRSASRRDGPLA